MPNEEKQYNPNDYRMEQSGSQIFGGLADLIQASQPQRDEKQEERLKKVAKYGAMADILRVLSEGVGLAVGQSMSKAVPNITPMGVNPAVTMADKNLQKIQDEYSSKENIYNQQLLAQKLREINYDVDRDKYNAGLGREQAKEEKYDKRYEDARIDANKKYQDVLNQNKEEKKEKANEAEASKFGIMDMRRKDDPAIKFTPTQEYQYAQYLLSKYPELRNLKREKIVTDGFGNKTTTLEQVGSDPEDIRWIISNANLHPVDYDIAAKLTGIPPVSSYPEAHKEQPVQNEQIKALIELLQKNYLDQYNNGQSNNEQIIPQQQVPQNNGSFDFGLTPIK